MLIVLGCTFGGNVKHLVLAVVDQDHGMPAILVRELAGARASGTATVDLVEYADPDQVCAGRHDWLPRLMRHEMREPTPGFVLS